LEYGSGIDFLWPASVAAAQPSRGLWFWFFGLGFLVFGSFEARSNAMGSVPGAIASGLMTALEYGGLRPLWFLVFGFGFLVSVV